jgi:hypothetical protein
MRTSRSRTLNGRAHAALNMAAFAGVRLNRPDTRGSSHAGNIQR